MKKYFLLFIIFYFLSPFLQARVLTSMNRILDQYNYVDPNGIVPDRPLELALTYYDSYKNYFPNTKYITVVDLKAYSGNRRFYLIDMQTGKVQALHTAHGSGSDTNNDGYAERFSNTVDSRMSSVGFYRTAETYNGSNGYSLKLDGLSPTNSNARKRAIVIHGADYVSPAENIVA
jgi:hypothetical protein